MLSLPSAAPFSDAVLLREQSHSLIQPITDADHPFTCCRSLFDRLNGVAPKSRPNQPARVPSAASDLASRL